jgi:hypothetical protein
MKIFAGTWQVHVFSLSPSKKIDPTAKQAKSIYHFLLGEKKSSRVFHQKPEIKTTFGL